MLISALYFVGDIAPEGNQETCSLFCTFATDRKSSPIPSLPRLLDLVTGIQLDHITLEVVDKTDTPRLPYVWAQAKPFTKQELCNLIARYDPMDLTLSQGAFAQLRKANIYLSIVAESGLRCAPELVSAVLPRLVARNIVTALSGYSESSELRSMLSSCSLRFY